MTTRSADADLRRGNSGAVQLPHGVVHVAQQLAQLSVEAVTGVATCAQQRLAHLQYAADRHRAGSVAPQRRAAGSVTTGMEMR